MSFVGNLIDKFGRDENIEFLSKNGISAEAYGYGSKNGEIPLGEMVEIFNKSKINLNFTQISSKNSLRKELKINEYLRSIKGRATEIALCGGFVLSEYAIGMEYIFELDKEIVIFKEKEEMLEKIIYFLKNDEKRNEIARNGYLRALKDYEISTAIPKLITEINKIRIQKQKCYSRPIYTDKDFIKNYTTFRVLMIAKLIKLGKIRFVFQEMWIIIKNRRLNLSNSCRYFIRTIFPYMRKIYLRCIGFEKWS